MALNIDGTTGISGVDGSASAPALQGTDSNTGINFASDTVNINTGGVTRATITSTGDLGIGISAPDVGNTAYSAVQVHSSSSNAYYKLSNGTTGSGSGDGLEFSLSGSDGYITNRESANLIFRTAATERMRIDSSGRVMIGTTNSSSGAGVGIKLAYGTTNPTVNTVINQSAGNHSFYHLYNENSTNNGYRFYVQANGGIANHSGNNVNLSDERMKKNITNMGSVYNIFKQFVFKDFNYISDNDSDAKKHGVIAQEVETIDSDLITEDFKISGDNDENYVYRKGLKEEQFVMIGLKTLQEAIAKIEVLETKVAALEAG